MSKKSFFPEDSIKPMSIRKLMYLTCRYKPDSEKDESNDKETESNEEKVNSNQEEFHPNAIREKICSDVGGKWMLFLDKSVIPIERGMTHLDYSWQFLKPLVDDFKNTGIVEVSSSTAYPGGYPVVPNCTDGAICCFTKDYRNTGDAKRAAEAIRKAFYYPKDLYYKTNDASIDLQYRCFGHKNISIYKHTLESKMYERDRNNLWVPVT